MEPNGRITIVGLGNGDENDLTLGVLKILRKTEQLFLRTEDHPVVPWLKEQGLTFSTFDTVYEQHDQFAPVYADIVEQLITAANGRHVVYAVPGHPMVAEQTTQLLLQQGQLNRIDVEVKGGRSFLEAVFARFELDPINGFVLLNALGFTARQCHPRMTTVIAQVYNQVVASDVKLTLMERYPDDYEVIVAHALGIAGQERIQRVPLYELDHGFSASSLSLVIVPPVPEDDLLPREFADFIDVVATLRGPDGCPWDRKQTHESLRKYLVEETAEFIEAVNEQDAEHMCEELGDVLLQIALHAQIAAENEAFSISDVIESITEKMIRRHPHVFGDVEAENVEEAVKNWETIKQGEIRVAGQMQTDSLSAGIPAELPTLSRVTQLQKRAAKVGFDWQDVRPVVDKVKEELTECLKAGPDEVEMELGDLLFAVVNLARFLGVDAEQALRRAAHKFTARFDKMAKKAASDGQNFQQLTLEQKEILWQKVKQEETQA